MAEMQDSRGAVVVPHSATFSLPASLAASAEAAAQQPHGTLITTTSEKIAAAKRCVASWRAKLRPAPDDERGVILRALSDVVGKPDALRNGTATEIEMFWTAYHADLGYLPSAVLSRACATWRRSGEAWFPTPGQLLKCAAGDEAWRRDAAILKGLERLTTATPHEVAPDSDEGRAEMLARSEAYRARLREAVVDDPALADGKAALDWYRSPRDWSKRPGSAA